MSNDTPILIHLVDDYFIKRANGLNDVEIPDTYALDRTAEVRAGTMLGELAAHELKHALGACRRVPFELLEDYRSERNQQFMSRAEEIEDEIEELEGEISRCEDEIHSLKMEQRSLNLNPDHVRHPICSQLERFAS